MNDDNKHLIVILENAQLETIKVNYPFEDFLNIIIFYFKIFSDRKKI